MYRMYGLDGILFTYIESPQGRGIKKGSYRGFPCKTIHTIHFFRNAFITVSFIMTCAMYGFFPEPYTNHTSTIHPEPETVVFALQSLSFIPDKKLLVCLELINSCYSFPVWVYLKPRHSPALSRVYQLPQNNSGSSRKTRRLNEQ